MKKVCILTTVHPPFDTRIFHKQAKTLAKAGYDVTLVAQHDRDEVIEGIKIIHLPKSKNRFHRMFINTLRAFLIGLRQKADIYHYHDPELIPIGILLKAMGKKVIYDVHEDVPKQILSKYWIPKWMRKTVAILFNLIEKFASYFFDGIITATDDIYSNFRFHKNVVVIRNFPLLSIFGSNNPERTENNSNNFKLIYIGGLCPERGITQIVEAMGYVNLDKNVRLILCGKFSPSSYEVEVKRLKGFERVVYLGWLPYERIQSLLGEAAAGLVTLLPISNYITSMPVKLFEYMAAGLPVIASNFPLWREIVEGNKCGICVDPLSPQEIARAVEYLIEHPEEAKRMGENGRKAVLERYNWEREGERLLNVYEQILQL